MLYYEIYSANIRFGLIDGFAGHAVLPERFVYKSVANKKTLDVNKLVREKYGFTTGPYTLSRGHEAFDLYLNTSGSLARSTQYLVDKANSYLSAGEAKWTIKQMEILGNDRVETFILIVGKEN